MTTTACLAKAAHAQWGDVGLGLRAEIDLVPRGRSSQVYAGAPANGSRFATNTR